MGKKQQRKPTPRKARKLQLFRESLRRLEDGTLDLAQGGMAPGAAMVTECSQCQCRDSDAL